MNNYEAVLKQWNEPDSRKYPHLFGVILSLMDDDPAQTDLYKYIGKEVTNARKM